MPGQSCFYQCLVQVFTGGSDHFTDQSFAAVVFIVVLNGDGLPEAFVRHKLFGGLPVGLFLFRAINMGEADSECFVVV